MKHFRKKRRILTSALVLFLFAAVWWGNTSLETDEYIFSSARLPVGFDGLCIVQLSDLHGRHFGARDERLLAAVAAAEPELIVLTGDFVDEHSTAAELETLLRGLAALAPVYYVTGNHEWGAHRAAETVAAFSQYGVTCLQNEFVTLERNGDAIVLAGIHDPNGYADQKTPEQLAAEVRAASADPFWLLLAHRNNLFNGHYCRLGADLTFSGHAHGGIWRLPFTDGLIDSGMTLFPSFTNGFYRCTDEDCAGAEVFVSRGLGNSPRWLPRLFNRPQVAVITLEREE